MKFYAEKRTRQRCHYQINVTCAHFNSDYFYHAKITNHSKDGIYIESNLPLKPGESIYNRVENQSPKIYGSGVCNCGESRILALAEVRWREEIKGAHDSYYGVCLKYY